MFTCTSLKRYGHAEITIPLVVLRHLKYIKIYHFIGLSMVTMQLFNFPK